MANALLMLDDGTHRWATVPGGQPDPRGQAYIAPPPERLTHEGIPFHRVGTFENIVQEAPSVKVAELYHQGVQFVDWKEHRRKKRRNLAAEMLRAGKATDDFLDAWTYLQEGLNINRRGR